mgnify:CR=1 FL=1
MIPIIKLILSSLLLLTPTQATTEEISMQIICDELLIELADAIDNGLLTATEGENIAIRCESLI